MKTDLKNRYIWIFPLIILVIFILSMLLIIKVSIKVNIRTEEKEANLQFYLGIILILEYLKYFITVPILMFIPYKYSVDLERIGKTVLDIEIQKMYRSFTDEF